MTLQRCCCCESELATTEITHRLFDVLHKWEANGVALSQETWFDYPINSELILYQCEHCGFGMFLPMTVGSDAFYTDITRDEYYLKERWDFHVAIQVMRSHASASVLDIGCGRGAFLSLVTQQLPSVTCHGNDSNPAVQGMLPPGTKLHVSLSEAPDNLDMVTLFQVIEHVADPVALLKASVAKLRLGGLVVVSVPDHSGPIRFFADSHTAIPPHHVSIWTPESLDCLFDRLGLSIITRRKEPLPDYLMPFYLPKILAHRFGVAGNFASETMLSKWVANPIINLCTRLGIKSLPIPGHTYLVIAQKSDGPVS